MSRSMFHCKWVLSTRPLLVIVALIGMLWSADTGAAAVRAQTRTARGEVVAINLAATPQIIVVSTKVGKQQEELIVGASVEAGIPITQGRARLHLNDLTVGQTVTITYVKSEQGLRAQAIRVRSR